MAPALLTLLEAMFVWPTGFHVTYVVIALVLVTRASIAALYQGFAR
jgi:hypothetical protein